MTNRHNSSGTIYESHAYCNDIHNIIANVVSMSSKCHGVIVGQICFSEKWYESIQMNPEGKPVWHVFPVCHDWLAWRPSMITIRPIVTLGTLVGSNNIWSSKKSATWQFQSWSWYAIPTWGHLAFQVWEMCLIQLNHRCSTLWKLYHAAWLYDAYVG